MKKLLIASLMSIFLMVSTVWAITWHTANQITVAWDAVTTVTAPDILKYGVYTKMLPGDATVFLGEQDGLSAVITFEIEGKYIIGVTSVRYVDVGTPEEKRLESEINWSDENGENTPDPFGSSYYITPGPPKNLRKN